MSAAIVAIRPQPGCAATVACGRELGLEIAPWPLFEIGPVQWAPPAREGIDGLLLGSANGLRHAGPALEAFRGLPAYAVGKATAAAAEGAGLPVAAVGETVLQDLLDGLEAPLTLLRLAGEEHVPVRIPAGIAIETRIVYRVLPLPVPDGLGARLRDGALVLLHSAAAARHFAAECDRIGVPRAAVALAALAPRVAEAAGSGWRECRAARAPNDAALLALVRDMCHDLPPG